MDPPMAEEEVLIEEVNMGIEEENNLGTNSTCCLERVGQARQGCGSQADERSASQDLQLQGSKLLWGHISQYSR